MAKINRTFAMAGPPEQAQAAFVRDLVPELQRKADLSLWKQRPGALEFAAVAEPSARMGRGWQVESQILRRARHEPRLLRFGPRIHVTFEQDDLGTRVTIKGRCEREFCDALELLGAPGRWPTAESRRDG